MMIWQFDLTYSPATLYPGFYGGGFNHVFFVQSFLGNKDGQISFTVEAGSHPKDAIKSCGATLIDGLMAVFFKTVVFVSWWLLFKAGGFELFCPASE